MPIFSVIIPLFNKGPHIKRAIESVLFQKIQDFELIIVDDGSTDEGAMIAKSFLDSRIKLIQQENLGVSAARNRGIKESTSNLIAFLDADDEWMPSHLETLLRLAIKYPEVGLYSTAYKISKNNGSLRWGKYNGIPSAPWEGKVYNYFLSVSKGEHLACSSTACIPKNVLIDIGGFPENAWYGEDVDLFGRIALKYPVAFSWDFGAIYHWEATNRACNKQLPLEEDPFVKIAKKSIQTNFVSPLIVDDLKEYIAKKEINRAKRYVDVGKNKIAFQILKEQNTKYNRKRKMIVTIKAIIPFFIFNKARQIKKL